MNLNIPGAGKGLPDAEDWEEKNIAKLDFLYKWICHLKYNTIKKKQKNYVSTHLCIAVGRLPSYKLEEEKARGFG